MAADSINLTDSEDESLGYDPLPEGDERLLDVPIIEYGGEVFKLACLPPSSFPTSTPPPLGSALVPWTKSQIEDAIRAKNQRRRDIFSGSLWILDQKQVGSCNAGAAVSALRRARYLRGIDNGDPIHLSWEFLYAQINGGRDNGSTLSDGMKAIRDIGAPPLDLQKHPINKHIYKKYYTPEDYRDAALYRAGAIYTISNEIELATLILSGVGAAVVAVDVNNSFMKLDKNGIAGGGSGVGNHSVCVDDVDIIDGVLAFDMPNTWGLNYGEGGRARLTWSRHFRPTQRFHGFYAILSSNDGGGGGPVVAA